MAYVSRRQELLDYLQTKKVASVEELSNMLYVSEATVRRDLTELQKLGLVIRSHGGAALADSGEHSILIRQEKNVKEKMASAMIALKNMPEFQTVFIDNSSTCLALVERMNLTHKTVVTNGLQVALRISGRDDVTLITPGGEIKSNSTAMIGSMALNTLRDFRFDLALLSCSAVDDAGSYELSLDSMLIKKLAIENSSKRLLVFDETKVNLNSHYLVAPLHKFDALISGADDEALAKLRAVHPNVINH